MTDEELIARLRNYGHVGTVLEAADRIEALVGEVARLTKERDAIECAFMDSCDAYDEQRNAFYQAEDKVEKLVEALRRIREAWPTVRDAEGSGGTISAAIDEIDAALAEIEGDQK